MLHRVMTAFAAFVLYATTLSYAQTPSPSPLPDQPQPSETRFVTSIQKDLMARFPTAADAERAGYFRYTSEDKTGAISYANLHWTSTDPEHPSQLWYDVSGKLIGADFSEPRKSPTDLPPQVWGVLPQRWTTFRAHVHYVLAGEGGKETYGATSVAKFTGAGGNVNAPVAQPLVKLGAAKSASDVKHVFLFPAIWDLQVWVTPNPNGAFAETNPLVHPSANAETGDM